MSNYKKVVRLPIRLEDPDTNYVQEIFNLTKRFDYPFEVLTGMIFKDRDFAVTNSCPQYKRVANVLIDLNKRKVEVILHPTSIPRIKVDAKKLRKWAATNKWEMRLDDGKE